MLTLEQVNDLVTAMVANDVETLEVEGKGYALRLKRTCGQGGSAKLSRRRDAQSPASGTFHARGGDDGLTELERGAQVTAGEPIGYITQGPLRFVCTSPATGTLAGRLPSDGTPVKASAPLVSVEIGP